MSEHNISGIADELSLKVTDIIFNRETDWSGKLKEEIKSSITSLLDSIELECDKTIKFVDSSSGYTTRDAMTFWDGRKKTAEDIKSQLNKIKE